MCVCIRPIRFDAFNRYTKAYYRRASGNFALGKYKEALKDFRKVCTLEPQDKTVSAGGIDEPFCYRLVFDGTPAHHYRDELADLAERINSLKSVGAV